MYLIIYPFEISQHKTANSTQMKNISYLFLYSTLITTFLYFTLPQKSLATLDGENVDPEIAVHIEMRDVLKVHGAQT